jgi:chain length determinant protein tyrosine kinase EpsG
MLSTKVRNADRSIGAILIDAGRLAPKDAERILQYQQQSDLRFGEAGVDLGLLTEADILYALSLQFDYPFLQPGGSQPIDTEVVAAYKPFSNEGERLRALRSQLQLRWFDEAGRRTALAVVSDTRHVGRSHLAANLAVTFAQLGQRTLLIDGDLRAPRQHKLFKIENRTGLSSLLAGRMQDQVVTFVHGIPGLAVLPSGPQPPNPAELLSRPAFKRILDQSKSSFDVVLVDTPSFDVGADAAILARSTGAALALARNNLTRTSGFGLMVGSLADAGVFMVGSVLVDVPLPLLAKAQSNNRS